MPTCLPAALRRWILALGILAISSHSQPWPSVSKTVQYVGFIGDRANYNGSTPRKRYAGMLGLRFQGTAASSIYGYTPDTELLDDKEALIEAILSGESWPGQVLDHDVDFADATQSPHGFIFAFYDVHESDCKEADCGLANVLADVEQSGQGSTAEPKEWTGSSRLKKIYGFPPWAARKFRSKDHSSCDSSWGQTCFHGGTYPASVGLPIPKGTESAMFGDLLSALASLEGAFCRCYKSGAWLPSVACDKEREKQLFDACSFDEPSKPDGAEL